MPRPLEEYRAKRDFQKSPEPRGKKGLRPANYPRFVIQKHDATRLHYDLRLEVDGVFKSWAVTRGPSLDPKVRRLAVEVEDHPLDYGDFEGTIPKGEYGGGTVMVWDRGYWSIIGEKSPSRALAEGELKFTIGGSKLKGSFVLVRMKNDKTGGSRHNWLLIKHRDEWARPGDKDRLLANDRSAASGRTMQQIAAGRGKGPSSFIVEQDRSARPDAVWSSSQKHARKQDRNRPAPKIKSVSAVGDRVLGIAISHPDKTLWQSAEPITKRMLCEYLATVGPWMIQHVQGRPCSLLRAPDGIESQTFFQRHLMPGMPPSINAVRVGNEKAPYLQIDTVEGLVAMGQFGAVEFHPWNCERGAPDVPGRLIFDLDPAPDVPFASVVDAAKELRQRLERLGLNAFCKTTGGKGLHVVTPLKTDTGADLGWDEAKMFAHAVSAAMAGDSPTRFVTKMAKAVRKGRIFLDYLRNDRTSTAVAPLSPRARPGATVSMPLAWSQVRRDLDPTRFNMKTAATLLAKGNPWPDYHKCGRPLEGAIKQLIGSR